jgi:hypothetical protein
MTRPAGGPAKPRHGQIMKDREYPGARIGVGTALVPAADGAFEAILNKIVRGRAIPQQGTRIAAQRGYQRLDQAQHVVHDRGPY